MHRELKFPGSSVEQRAADLPSGAISSSSCQMTATTPAAMGRPAWRKMKYYNSVLLAACSTASMMGTTLHSRASRAPPSTLFAPIAGAPWVLRCRMGSFQKNGAWLAISGSAGSRLGASGAQSAVNGPPLEPSTPESTTCGGPISATLATLIRSTAEPSPASPAQST